MGSTYVATGRHDRRRWRATLLTAAIVLALYACSSDSKKTAASAASTEAADATTTSIPVLDTKVDIGGGRLLHVRCTGAGSPTVILEAGDEGGIGDFRAVTPKVAERTRTCAYERLGLGSSSQATGCRQLDDINDDLDALLEGAGLRGPYVFVGVSGGGYLAVGMAERHAAELAGIVLGDTAQAIPVESAPPELVAALKCDAPKNIERRDYAAVEHAAWDDRHHIADVPVVIISDDSSEAEPGNVEQQKGWLVLSPKAKQVVVHSGHVVAENESTLLADSILEIVKAAR